jgi:putative CocE/NonD family hydrolase
MRSSLLLVAFAALCVAPVPALAQRSQFDLRIPTRDGVELSANAWFPEGTGPFPTVLVRTPYIKANDRYPAQGKLYTKRGYAVVAQDDRGRGDSDGRFDFFFADGKDGYDAIEWISRQPWSNVRVGMVGGSYLATVQWLAARDRPPHLVCLIPQAPAGRYFEELPYIGGAWLMQWSLNWINGTSGRSAQGPNLGAIDWEKVYAHRPLLTMDEAMGRKMPLYRDFLTHSTIDEYWKRILFTEDDFRKIDLPALTFTGWFDADQPGAMSYWIGMRKHSPARDRQFLIVGPWQHGEAIRGGSLAVGELRFSGESVVNVDSLHLAFFDYCLAGSTPAFRFPRARVYLMGANVWRDFDEYPPREAGERSFYLTSGGNANSLAGDGQLAWTVLPSAPPDHYTYDPKNPAPSQIGGESYAWDYRAIERRQDVLVYTSQVLTQPLEIAGPVSVMLDAESDARDTDFIARILDVQPDGRVLKLGWWEAGAMRARYRQGYDREILLTPGKLQEYRIALGHLGHVFLPGHRVRIDVTSSAYPFFHPNPNTGNPVATDTASRAARQTIYQDRAHPSRLVLPILAGAPMP